MKTLDTKTLKKFLNLAGERLTGEWILMGGTLLPLLGIEHRVTTDIDLVGLTEKERAQSLNLMQLAEDLSLPIEGINQAAGFFLFKIKGFEKQLIPLHKGKKATIYRPDINLFLRLKIGRMSESDLADCLEILKIESGSLDPRRMISFINDQIKKSSKPKAQRLEVLLKAIKS